MLLEMTEAEYAEQQRLAALTTCATCGAETARNGEHHARDVDYCSSLCARLGERKLSQYTKPQPAGVRIENNGRLWDV